MMRRVARTAVVAGTATAVSNRVSRRQANRWQDQAEAEQAAAYQPPPEPQGSSQDDKLDQLKQLGELKTAGVLTDAEFEAQKAQILAG
jgi:hypothetical protein